VYIYIHIFSVDNLRDWDRKPTFIRIQSISYTVLYGNEEGENCYMRVIIMGGVEIRLPTSKYICSGLVNEHF